MSEARDYPLGPVTEARFAAAFERKAIVGISVASDLLGMDEKTIETLTKEHVIRSVPKGTKHRGYTERDLRAYLLESPAFPCAVPEPSSRAKSQPRAAGANVRVVNFSERKRAKG